MADTEGQQTKLRLDSRRKLVRQEKFLTLFQQTAHVGNTCKEVGITRSGFDRWCERDPDFKVRYQAAQEQAAIILEDEAVRRAHEGWEEPVFQKGEQVGVVRKCSDVLLIFLLKGLKPQKYRERVEHSGGIDLQGIEERLKAGRARMQKGGERDKSRVH